MEAKKMHVEVIDIVDNEDGGATVVLEMNNEAAHAFLSLGVLSALEAWLYAAKSSEEEQQ